MKVAHAAGGEVYRPSAGEEIPKNSRYTIYLHETAEKSVEDRLAFLKQGYQRVDTQKFISKSGISVERGDDTKAGCRQQSSESRNILRGTREVLVDAIADPTGQRQAAASNSFGSKQRVIDAAKPQSDDQHDVRLQRFG